MSILVRFPQARTGGFLPAGFAVLPHKNIQQLVDFAAGITNGYLRGALLSRGKYEFATDLFNEFILPNLRRYPDGRIMGYGVREVPHDTAIRNKLATLFEMVE